MRMYLISDDMDSLAGMRLAGVKVGAWRMRKSFWKFLAKLWRIEISGYY